MKTIKQIIDEQSQSNDKIIAIDEILSSTFFEKPDDLSENEKLFVYIENLEREINNGGFNQYFFNLSGNHAQETVQALKKIKANKTATLLEKAIEQFPDSNVPSDRIERQEIMEKVEDKADEVWDELDNSFYKYEDDIAELLLDFVKNNIDDFTH